MFNLNQFFKLVCTNDADDDHYANEEDAAALAKRPTKKTNTRKLQPQLEPGLATAASAANPGKILNPFTNRWVINNPANQKKIGKLTLKKGGRKNKSCTQKRNKTKKHA